ncbi:CocE/NonD family hydrolase [uncultured Sphingomonas sp.]|uniref:CocE/NonD family hydrolase n=1 Tax=uncultured Sphingomonas sp. TaxID=158754 RepID=UPI0035CA3741
MLDIEPVLAPAYPLDQDSDQGHFSAFDPGTRTLPAGFQVEEKFMPLPVEIILDKDVAITLRDGVTIYADVFRPVGVDKAPVIVGWSPYGKSRGNAPLYVRIFQMLGMDTRTVSGLMRFEGPDPAFWCAHGYAVCNPDPRGSFRSEGDLRVWSRQEGEDCHDVIEWLAGQDWCSGKVATSGNSYLAIAQWFAAAEQPPHLAAIAPWEGMSDIYRDLVMRGGIPDFPFPKTLERSFVGQNQREDLVAEAERHPLMDEFWQTKTPAFEKITVPAYVVASYSNSIHTPGTFRGWRRIASADKWLRIHNTMEWPDYYEEEHLSDLLRFFDFYLKGIDNGWRETPRVRYAVLDLEGGDRVNETASHFPPADVTLEKYYLDAGPGSLGTQAPTAAASATYDGASADGSASFTIRFDEGAEFVGYPKLRLFVEANGGDDLDVFALLQKLNADGEALEQFNVPNKGPQMDAVTRNGAAILKYKGVNGRLRASMRALDEAESTDAIPVHRFAKVEKLAPGEVACLDIDLFPMGLALHPGEQLRLILSGQHLLGGVMPGTDNVPNANTARHVIHTGGQYASYLQLPMKPKAA